MGRTCPATGYLGNFKLMRTAAAYWRGSEKNPQLQRIYGTAWESRDELKAYLTRLEEAAKRDHRKLGAELDLFSFPDEIGSGLAVFHPKGGVLRKVMEDYSRQRHVEDGYEFVYTPHITKAQLFETSGHLDWYADGMYPPMHLDEERGADGQIRKQGQDYYLKPMNCPMHNLIFAARGRSYRELPLRLFEFGTVYRLEKSGVVHGMTRARGFTQDDAHIYCTREQMRDELRNLLTFVLGLLADYGLDDFYLELSTKNPDKFVGSDEVWEEATETLREVAEGSGLELVPDPGGAAFYGPKISVQTTRRDRPDLADVDDPAGLQPAGAVRAGVHRARRLPAAAGDDPPRAVRLDRAVRRRPDRALRRRLPALAGPGPGGRHPGHRRPRGLPVRRRRAAEGAGDPGRGGLVRRPDAEEDPERAEVQGAVHADRR